MTAEPETGACQPIIRCIHAFFKRCDALSQMMLQDLLAAAAKQCAPAEHHRVIGDECETHFYIVAGQLDEKDDKVADLFRRVNMPTVMQTS